MNYLAHAYLSFSKPEIVVGNMISDFVKGKQQFTFSAEIQNGIKLHRLIDAFTDQHEATKRAKMVFKKAVGTYSGAFVDVVYDHFLATDASEMSLPQLERIASDTYAILNQFRDVLPPYFLAMLPYMEKQNWLYHYHEVWGIEKSFQGIVRRAAYLDDSAEAYVAFHQHYDELKHCYQLFFPDVKSFAIRQLALL